jgi:hypothetical protein
MVQFAPAATVVFWQLSVSLKSPVMAIAPGSSSKLPVFAKVTGSALLLVPKT